MGTWLVWWFVIGIVSAVAVLAVLIALGRHILLLGRTARQVQDELTPLAEEVSRESARATQKASSLQLRRPGRSADGDSEEGSPAVG